MAVLIRTRGINQGRWIYPLGRRCLLGRHPECDIADLFVNDSAVSRHHAQILRDRSQYFIEDKGSRNGTFVNGDRLAKAKQLHNGDRINIAGIELTFFEDEHEPEIPPPTGEFVSAPEPSEHECQTLSVSAEPLTVPGTFAGGPSVRLHALLRRLTSLGQSLDVDRMLHDLFVALFEVFPLAQVGCAIFTASADDDFRPRATHFRVPATPGPVRVSRALLEQVIARREAVLWNAAVDAGGAPLSASLDGVAAQSLVCAPLLDSDGNVMAVVQLDSDNSEGAFSADDLELLTAGVSHAAIAVRFAQLHEQAVERRMLERDLRLARRMQLSLLPVGYPTWPGMEFFAYYQSAYALGGDYYDFVELPRDRLALIVADVSSKGISAALLMAKLSGELKYYLSNEQPSAAVARMNEILCASGEDRFVSLLLIILERSNPTLTLINAGHLAPLCRRAGGAVELIGGEPTRGVALGVLREQAYPSEQFELQPGDVWLAYANGVVEAAQRDGVRWGMERLQEALAAAAGGPAEVGPAVVRAVHHYIGNHPQPDDMCLMAWGRRG